MKSIDGTTLVIARSGKMGELTLTVVPSTYREGTIQVGAVVSVRYREEGTRHIATAIAAQRLRN